MSHKDDGNYHFQKKDYKNAIKGYTEGLKQKHDDKTLTAVMYTNRAAANFHLGNNRSALNDATWALKSKPDHMKAILRGAICCYDMEKYNECIEWCEKGLKENKLIDLKKKSTHQMKQQDRDKRKAEMKAVKNLTERNQLINAIQSRNIKLECHDNNSNKKELEDLLSSHGSAHSGKIYLDEKKKLHWAVYFLYPEYNQSDFIEDFNEGTKFIDQLLVVFDSSPEWDTEKAYTADTVQVFFEDRERSLLIHVSPETTLRKILSDKRFTLRGGCPAFMVMSKTTNFYKETFENQQAEEF